MFVHLHKYKLFLIRVFTQLLLVSFFYTSLAAQDVAVPVSQHLPLMFKIFNFDRYFKSRITSNIVICVVYQKKYRASENIKNEVIETGESKFSTYLDYRVQYNFVSIDDASELESYLSKHSATVLYIAPLRAIDINEIGAIAARRKIITVTGIPDYVYRGISVGIDIKGDKPQILINLNQSKLENADFSSQLLKLAKVID